jgi:hypothetical protein
MPTEIEQQQLDLFARRRRRRNIALGIALAAFVLIFYVLTFVKMGLYHTL